MTSLDHRLDRIVAIGAPPDLVFRFFTDDRRWASWWGAGSTIDARPGGRVLIRNPGGIEVAGEVLEVAPPTRLVFTYGFVSGEPIPVGGSRVTIRLEPDGDGTRLHLTHEFAASAVRDQHVQGWRYQLSVFANAVADERHAGAPALVDAWLGAWSEPDAVARLARLSAIAAPAVGFRDRFSLVQGVADLNEHVGASQRFMPGLRLERRGHIRQCQGTVLADWVALAADGAERGRGTNVFALDAAGRIAAVTGFWAQPS